MDGTQGRRDVVEEISLKLGVYWVQVPENQIVPGERGRGRVFGPAGRVLSRLE